MFLGQSGIKNTVTFILEIPQEFTEITYLVADRLAAFVWRISLIHRFTAASEITFVFSSASDESKEAILCVYSARCPH